MWNLTRAAYFSYCSIKTRGALHGFASGLQTQGRRLVCKRPGRVAVDGCLAICAGSGGSGNDEARTDSPCRGTLRFADAWKSAPDIAAGRQCEAYGAPAVMQIPERLHIAWQDDETLRVQTDEGMQTRLLHFDAASSDPASPSLQGTSRSRWAMFALTNPAGAAAPQSPAQRYGTLVVTTGHLMPGLLRKNGVPYSAHTQLSEYWKLHDLRTTRWLLISSKVTDPEYLAAPYVYDSIFQQEPDGARWAPSACSLTS